MTNMEDVVLEDTELMMWGNLAIQYHVTFNYSGNQALKYFARIIISDNINTYFEFMPPAPTYYIL